MHGIYAFLQSQLSTIQPGVYDIRYPDIQYRRLVPVVTSGSEWAGTIVHFSSDGTGKAAFTGPDPTGVPLVDESMQKHVVNIENAGIGYRYGLQELRQAQLLGMDVDARRASLAFRVAEELLDTTVLDGVTAWGWDSLINSALTGINKADAPHTGTGATNVLKRLWSGKDGGNITDDVNEAIDSVWNTTKTVEMPNTLAIPPTAMRSLIAKRIPNTSMTALEYLMKNNLYTAITKQPLQIEVIRGLENAGASNVGRMMVYPRDENALRFHLPMPYTTLPPFQDHPASWLIHGMLRTGGLEILLPAAIAYRDGITT